MTRGAVELTIEELADRAGLSVRTIRFYIGQGLLSGPGTRGKGATYGEDHLLRLRLIRRLVDQRVPLADLRERVGRLSLPEIRALLAEADRQQAAETRAKSAPSPAEYVATLLERARSRRAPGPGAPPPLPISASSTVETTPTGEPPAMAPRSAPAEPEPPAQPAAGTWRRIELRPGLELHVRADLGRRFRPLIDRLIRLAQSSDPESPDAAVDRPVR